MLEQDKPSNDRLEKMFREYADEESARYAPENAFEKHFQEICADFNRYEYGE